jgi:hypothetical protein
MTAIKKFKIMAIIKFPDQYPTIGAILDPPSFSLDTSFNIIRGILGFENPKRLN